MAGAEGGIKEGQQRQGQAHHNGNTGCSHLVVERGDELLAFFLSKACEGRIERPKKRRRNRRVDGATNPAPAGAPPPLFLLKAR